MKLYLCFAILLLVDYTLELNCRQIKPTQPSDCILSKEDKKTYKYCCYEKTIFGVDCSPHTQYTKDIIDDLNEELPSSEDQFICNQSSYIKIGFLLFISFIIF